MTFMRTYALCQPLCQLMLIYCTMLFIQAAQTTVIACLHPSEVGRQHGLPSVEPRGVPL